MKKKIITALTVLSVFAFPMTSLAASTPSSQAPVCTVANCTQNGPHDHSPNCSMGDCTNQGDHGHASSGGTSGRTGHSRSHNTSHNTSAGRNHRS